MTIKQLNATIEEMRSIYPFDDTAVVEMSEDIHTGLYQRVHIETVDQRTGVLVSLDKCPRFDGMPREEYSK